MIMLATTSGRKIFATRGSRRVCGVARAALTFVGREHTSSPSSSRRRPGPIPRDLSIADGIRTERRVFVKPLSGIMGPGLRRDDTECVESARTSRAAAAYFAALAASAAAFRKQSRHRQSSPLTGIGSRAVSSAHQHSPDRSQPNSVPQPEQARRRGSGNGNSFGIVMICAKAWPSFSCRVHLRLRYIRRRAQAREAVGSARRTN